MPDPCTPVSVPAGSTHALGPRTHAPGPRTLAHTRSPHLLARRAHLARSHRVPSPTHSQGPSRTLAPGPLACSLAGPISHARTGSPRPLGLYARTHWVPMPAHSRGPHARSLAGSPCPLTRGVPTHACTHWAMHARSHWAPTAARFPCTHTPGPARMLTLGPHARSHAGSPCMRAPGLCTHARTGPPCPLACGVPMCTGSLHSCMLHPMLYVLVVICSSSTVVF